MPAILNRIAVIGDVHAEDQNLSRVLQWLETQSFDALLCTGDVVNGRGDAGKCIDLLRAANVLTVRGNHDQWFLAGGWDWPDATPQNALGVADEKWLQSLPATREFSTAVGPLLLCHGVGENNMQLLRPDDYGYALESNSPLQKLLAEDYFRVMIGGHSHRRMVGAFGDLVVINAGTLRGDHEPCFALVDFEARHVQFFDVLKDKIEAAREEKLQP